MATLRANHLKILIRSVQAAASPDQGGAVVELNIDERPASGTTDGQWDLASVNQYTIAASGTENVDLSSLSDAFGGAVSPAQIAALALVHEDSSSASSVDMTPNATNGFTSIQQDASDLTRLLPGQLALFADFGAGAGFAVSGSVKALDIVNNDGSNAATVTLYVWARSA